MPIKQDLGEIETVLLDIEGTICPISFVKDTLFPYAIEGLPIVLSTKWNDPEFKQYRDDFPEEHRGTPETFEAHVKDLTERDVKVPYLKNLQGYLWQTGYRTQAFSTPLFPDVLPHLKNWTNPTRVPCPLKISIYSSGSIFAQKLLFEHVQNNKNTENTNSNSDSNSSFNDTTSTTPSTGSPPKNKTIDIRPLISTYHDPTTSGPKTSSQSYSSIATALDRKEAPRKILFLSDNVSEVRAALQAGMKSVLVVRPGNAKVDPEDIESLDVVNEFGELGI